MLKKLIKLLVISAIFYQTPVYSKSASFYDFNSSDLTNYFSGIVAFENRDNSQALKFFNSSKVLLNKHNSYLKRYVYSLVLEDKVAKAINIIISSSNEENSDFFEAHILLIADSLKKNNFGEAEKYLDQSIRFTNQNRFNLVIFETLRKYIYTFKNKEISFNEKNFGNISIITQAFQRCYLKKENTRSSFLNLINNPDGDYSRYFFFLY